MKKLGCCTACGKEVYEIKRRYPVDHPYAKEPIKLGKPIDVTIKTLLLTDGSTMDLTYCNDCSVIFSKDWRTVLDAWVREISDEYRKNTDQSIIEDKQKSLEWLSEMIENLPLVVLGERRAGE